MKFNHLILISIALLLLSSTARSEEGCDAACEFDKEVLVLAEKYTPLAVEILKEAVRICEDFLEEDPLCGLSNHEGPRLGYLRKMIVEHKAVENEQDCFFDDFGNLVWTVTDKDDPTPANEKKVVYFDGHTDTVKALRESWQSKAGEGLDAYKGLIDKSKVNVAFLQKELGYLPPEDEWDHLVFGRGSADQLAGVVDTIIATKIMLELRHLGSLRGVIIRSYGTVCEEDNDGAGPLYLTHKVFPGAEPNVLPDVVVHTEGTGDRHSSPLGIYRGQRGRVQVLVEVTGKSSHGSMPWEGRNPLEWGARIITEATDQYQRMDGFSDDPFLSAGSRTASWSVLDTPSDCAVPEKFAFRFDRRLTLGETPDHAVSQIANLAAVTAARNAGLDVEISIPIYNEESWRGLALHNKQQYLGWMTPENHKAIRAAEQTYRQTIGRSVAGEKAAAQPPTWAKEPRTARWVFSTDGVGFPVPVDSDISVPKTKDWVTAGTYHYPAMFGLGAGYEHNTHKVGECVDSREMRRAIAFYTRFPSVFAAHKD